MEMGWGEAISRSRYGSMKKSWLARKNLRELGDGVGTRGDTITTNHSPIVGDMTSPSVVLPHLPPTNTGIALETSEPLYSTDDGHQRYRLRSQKSTFFADAV